MVLEPWPCLYNSARIAVVAYHSVYPTEDIGASVCLLADPLSSTMSSQPIRAILIDLSGTLHIESTPLPGAIRALQRLRASGIPFRFCSNTSKESTSSLCQKLRRIGFDIPPETERKEVWTSVGAVRQLLVDRGLKRLAVLFSLAA